MNASGIFAGRLELDRIGLMGRSFGGATTLMALGMEPRFTAGMAVVPPGWADPRNNLPAGMLVPAEEESVLLSAEGSFPLTTISKPTLLLNGAEDHLIIGLSAGRAKNGGGPVPTVNNPHPHIRLAYEKTELPVVWGLLADSNHSTLGVSAGYWWPELKPNTQHRYFVPESTFTLIEPELAQDMQKEKALALFDMFIRLDESARERLTDQSYKAGGLMLEARNI